MRRPARFDQNDTISIENIKKELKEERKRKRKERRRRFFKRLIKFVVFVGFVVALYVLDQSKISRVRHIEVSGNQYLAQESLISKSGIKEGDRLISTHIKSLFSKLNIEGVENQEIKVYYTKGLITLNVKEFAAIGYFANATQEVIFSNNTFTKSHLSNLNNIPKFVGFEKKDLLDHPKIAQNLTKIDPSAFHSISEIHIEKNPLESIYLKFIMNNGFFIFTNANNILLLDYYPEIVSGIKNGANPDNRCIYFLDHGPSPTESSAVSKPCP